MRILLVKDKNPIDLYIVSELSYLFWSYKTIQETSILPVEHCLSGPIANLQFCRRHRCNEHSDWLSPAVSPTVEKCIELSGWLSSTAAILKLPISKV